MLHKRDHYTVGGSETVYGPLELPADPGDIQKVGEYGELMEAIEQVRQGDTIEIHRDGHLIAVLVPPGYLED